MIYRTSEINKKSVFLLILCISSKPLNKSQKWLRTVYSCGEESNFKRPTLNWWYSAKF